MILSAQFSLFLLGIGNECIKELKNFEMDTQNKSAFEVANSLWDMIEQNQMQEA